MIYRIVFIDKGNAFEGITLDVDLKSLNPIDTSKKEVNLTAGNVLGIEAGPVFEIKTVTYLPEEDILVIESLYDSPTITRS